MRQSRHLGMNGMRQYYKKLDPISLHSVGKIISNTYYSNVVAAGMLSNDPPMGAPGGNVVAGYSSQTGLRGTLTIPIEWPNQKKQRINAIGFSLFIGAVGFHGSQVEINWAVSDLDPNENINYFCYRIGNQPLKDYECFLQGRLVIPVPSGAFYGKSLHFGCTIENEKIQLESPFYTKNKNKFFNGSKKYLYLWDGTTAGVGGNNNMHLLDGEPIQITLGYMGYSRIKD